MAFFIKHIPHENLTTEPNTNSFALLTLETLGFRIKEKREVMTRQVVTLTMNGKRTSSHVDVHIVDAHFPSYLAVGIVKEDNKHNAYAHLIGISIGVFQSNNAVRITNGKSPLDVMILPGMIWRYTTPTLYIIKITKELSDACAEGRVPEHETEIFEFEPLLPPSSSFGSLGMRYRANRICIFDALENWKDFIPSSAFNSPMPAAWKRFLTPEEMQLFVFEESPSSLSSSSRHYNLQISAVKVLLFSVLLVFVVFCLKIRGLW